MPTEWALRRFCRMLDSGSPMKTTLLATFRWLPRAAALLIAGGFLMIAAGELFAPHSGPPSRLVEWTGILLCAIGCLAPLLAWKWEMEGALLSLAALAAFVVIVGLKSTSIAAVMSTPALLFLGDWLLRRSLSGPSQSGSR